MKERSISYHKRGILTNLDCGVNDLRAVNSSTIYRGKQLYVYSCNHRALKRTETSSNRWTKAMHKSWLLHSYRYSKLYLVNQIADEIISKGTTIKDRYGGKPPIEVH